ncbi:DMT family transporter [Cellulophaga baltica]|uniref:DMT family transporter n=1 Tax=Cellulophaga TaxID=104264 RepID=UPI001C06AB05|nr:MULTISPECIES: DMT family transporter [Cellulophaga]MBU2997283.1 DMT family transporter [Cellulophaga baltica]MDO6768681.1 DMT family transporter [Cellulophaga sp. 1_MG-2023]
MDIKKALGFMILSTMSFTLMNTIVKYLVHIPAYEIVFFRSLGTLVLTMSYLLKNKISILGNKRKLLILRGVVGVTSMTLFFMSLKYLSIGTAVSLRYIAPIFAAVFAIFLLKEKIKPMQWLFFGIAFSGVLILKGFDGEVNNTGLLLILIAAFFSGLVYVLIGKIGKQDHPVVVVNYFMFIATLVGGTLMIFDWKTPEGIEWILLSVIGIFGYFGQLYMTKAFQLATTTQVAPLKYLEVLFTVVVGLFWFNEVYTLWSVLGMVMIIGGLILNALYKNKTTMKKKI